MWSMGGGNQKLLFTKSAATISTAWTILMVSMIIIIDYHPDDNDNDDDDHDYDDDDDDDDEGRWW